MTQVVVPSERSKLAWEMRKQGFTFQRIGEELGVQRERARMLCARYDRYLRKTHLA